MNVDTIAEIRWCHTVMAKCPWAGVPATPIRPGIMMLLIQFRSQPRRLVMDPSGPEQLAKKNRLHVPVEEIRGNARSNLTVTLLHQA